MKTFAILMGFLIFPLLLWADAGSNDFQLTSSAFEDNNVIPKQYTCDGPNVNPPLTFNNVPSEAKSIALTVADPDAPHGRWSHWVVYNISPDIGEIKENTIPSVQGVNSFGKYNYSGPCPPGGRLHHYIFQAYALDTMLSIGEGASISEVENSVQGHILAQTQLVGTYQK